MVDVRKESSTLKGAVRKDRLYGRQVANKDKKDKT